jgi:hypothetical protein
MNKRHMQRPRVSYGRVRQKRILKIFQESQDNCMSMKLGKTIKA